MGETRTNKTNTAQEIETSSVRRSTLTKVLPTDRLSVDKQIALARAFAAIYESNGGKPVTNDEAGATVTPNLAAGTVILTNSFFTDIGLLIRSDKGGFTPSPELAAYNKACQWGTDSAQEKLRPILERTWFYRALIPRLQLAPQAASACIAVLAEESGATREHEHRLTNLVFYLELAGIVRAADGKVTLLRAKPITTPPPPDENKKVKPLQPQEGLDGHILYLSSDKQRVVTLAAPLAISKAEYERICNWIKVTLIVEDEIKP